MSNSLQEAIVETLVLLAFRLLEVWVAFWAIDKLFAYHIDFTFVNVIAALVLTGILGREAVKISNNT